MSGRKIFRAIPAAALVSAMLSTLLLAAPVDPKAPAYIERLFQGGHYAQAVEGLQAAVGKTPEDGSLHYWLGRSFYELREYSHAIASLEKAVMLEPDNSEYHHWLGKACGRRAEEINPISALGLARRTHHEFETAVHLDRSNLAAQRDLIRFLQAAPGILGGGDDHALQQMAALALVDPMQADLARAEYFVARKRFDEAGQQYTKILESKPAAAGIYFEAAEYFMGRGDGEQMQMAVRGAAETGAKDARLNYYRGIAKILAKNHENGAEIDLRAYLANVPPSSEAPPLSSAHEWLGKLYEYEGPHAEAVNEYQAAIAIDPRNKALREGLRALQQEK